MADEFHFSRKHITSLAEFFRKGSNELDTVKRIRVVLSLSASRGELIAKMREIGVDMYEDRLCMHHVGKRGEFVKSENIISFMGPVVESRDADGIGIGEVVKRPVSTEEIWYGDTTPSDALDNGLTLFKTQSSAFTFFKREMPAVEIVLAELCWAVKS